MSLFSPRSAPESRSTWNSEGNLARLLEARGLGPRSVSLSVTPDTAMGHSVVNECVQMIANLSMLDVRAVRDVDGRQVVASSQPELIRAPSAELDDMEWRRQVLVSWLTRGTAFGVVARSDRFGFPAQIELLPAEVVSVRRERGGVLAPWVWMVDGQVMKRWPNGPLWVAPGLHRPVGVPVGVSPIEMALGAIGLGLAAEDFGASWFYDGAVPSAILYSDQELSGDDAKAIKAKWIDAIRGKREPAVMGAGLKYEQISVAANESQFLDALDRNAATVARFFLVPPNEVGAPDGGSMTYNNAESRVLALLGRCYQPWLARLERVLTRVTPSPFTARVQIDGLILTDIKTRTDVDATDVAAGIRTRDEVRQARNLPPLPEGVPA